MESEREYKCLNQTGRLLTTTLAARHHNYVAPCAVCGTNDRDMQKQAKPQGNENRFTQKSKKMSRTKKTNDDNDGNDVEIDIFRTQRMECIQSFEIRIQAR